MPKLSTLTARDLENTDGAFRYDVNINQEGFFTTTIPHDVAAKFIECGIQLQKNRLGNPGFFEFRTLEDLTQAMNNLVKEYNSKTLISEDLVIVYQIQTTCSYCLDKNGEPVPNGSVAWTQRDDYEWKSGTKEVYANDREPFGLLLYVRPQIRKVYKFKSGKTKTDFEWVPEKEHNREDRPNLNFLCSISSIEPIRGEDKMEIPYSEEVAAVFVAMLKSIFKLNEKIKDLINPEDIQRLASGKKLLF